MWHSTLAWPPEVLALEQSTRVPFEHGPLASGAPTAHARPGGGDAGEPVGGGYVESFAMGGTVAASSPGADGLLAVSLPERPFGLADAVGATSAFRSGDRGAETYARVPVWPGGERTSTPGVALTDGGDLENYGLVALLRRGVRALVVCINTLWPLDLAFDPEGWPDDLGEASSGRRALDPFLAPLFGAPDPRFPHNQVFPRADFAEVVGRLQAARRTGGPVVALTSHEVQANPHWGLEGGGVARVCWVYNDQVPAWESQLPAAVGDQIQAGRAATPAGPYRHFPHYLTRGQNPGALVALTAEQSNLLAHLTCWNLVESRELVARCLG